MIIHDHQPDYDYHHPPNLDPHHDRYYLLHKHHHHTAYMSEEGRRKYQLVNCDSFSHTDE